MSWHCDLPTPTSQGSVPWNNSLAGAPERASRSSYYDDAADKVQKVFHFLATTLSRKANKQASLRSKLHMLQCKKKFICKKRTFCCDNTTGGKILDVMDVCSTNRNALKKPDHRTLLLRRTLVRGATLYPVSILVSVHLRSACQRTVAFLTTSKHNSVCIDLQLIYK